MNISDPIWGPVVPNSTSSESAVSDTALANRTLASEQSQTANITSAISDAGGHLWSFKTYWVITGPLTLATILLPLMAGPTIRFVLRFSYNNKAYARLLLLILAIGFEVGIQFAVSPTVYLVVYGPFFGALAVFNLARATTQSKHELLWAFFAAMVGYSVLIDEFLLDSYPVPLTCILPLGFLIILWFSIENRHFIVHGFWLHITRTKLVAWLISFCGKYARRLLAIAIAFFFGLSVLIWIKAPIVGWVICVPPLGVLAINRMLHSFVVRENRFIWFSYAAIYGLFLGIDANGSSHVTSLVPGACLATGWVIHNTEAFFSRHWWRLKHFLLHKKTSHELPENQVISDSIA